MTIPPVPPHDPTEHLMHERNRSQEVERDARSRLSGKRIKGLSAGDKIIFLVLAVLILAGVWLFLSRLPTS